MQKTTVDFGPLGERVVTYEGGTFGIFYTSGLPDFVMAHQCRCEMADLANGRALSDGAIVRIVERATGQPFSQPISHREPLKVCDDLLHGSKRCWVVAISDPWVVVAESFGYVVRIQRADAENARDRWLEQEVELTKEEVPA
jgi:hypothetical protein